MSLPPSLVIGAVSPSKHGPIDENEPSLPARMIFGSKMRNVFSNFLAAFHESRRIQAKQIIRQYRHLTADDRVPLTSRARTGRNSEMATTNGSHAWRPSRPLKVWTIAVLVGFGILHVAGGYTLHYAASVRPIETAAVIHSD
jgi:hypothetical protein